MIVLGIDPGIAITGYGFIKLNDLNEPEMLAYGVIDSTAVRGTSSRLIFLFDELTRLIDQFRPDYCAVEKLFFSKESKNCHGSQ